MRVSTLIKAGIITSIGAAFMLYGGMQAIDAIGQDTSPAGANMLFGLGLMCYAVLLMYGDAMRTIDAAAE